MVWIQLIFQTTTQDSYKRENNATEITLKVRVGMAHIVFSTVAKISVDTSSTGRSINEHPWAAGRPPQE